MSKNQISTCLQVHLAYLSRVLDYTLPNCSSLHIRRTTSGGQHAAMRAPRRVPWATKSELNELYDLIFSPDADARMKMKGLERVGPAL